MTVRSLTIEYGHLMLLRAVSLFNLLGIAYARSIPGAVTLKIGSSECIGSRLFIEQCENAFDTLSKGSPELFQALARKENSIICSLPYLKKTITSTKLVFIGDDFRCWGQPDVSACVVYYAFVSHSGLLTPKIVLDDHYRRGGKLKKAREMTSFWLIEHNHPKKIADYFAALADRTRGAGDS